MDRRLFIKAFGSLLGAATAATPIIAKPSINDMRALGLAPKAARRIIELNNITHWSFEREKDGEWFYSPHRWVTRDEIRAIERGQPLMPGTATPRATLDVESVLQPEMYRALSEAFMASERVSIYSKVLSAQGVEGGDWEVSALRISGGYGKLMYVNSQFKR